MRTTSSTFVAGATTAPTMDAPRCGNICDNRPDKRLSQLAMATETRFGIMLREIGQIKQRKRGGYYYPLRIKDGA